MHAIEAALGFRLTQSQVGAVLWCAPGVDETNQAAALERHLPKLAAALDSRTAPLSVAPDAATLWAWIPATAIEADTVPEKLAGAGDDVRVALGEPAGGLAGFRTTHRQAAQAQTVALAAGPERARPLITASQLGPLALLGPDLTSAAAWVQSVLGPLAEDDEQHAQMRETAWAYLSSGGSLSAAAAALHLHKNTIQYRIRKAEETRGRPFDDGRLDVEVALLACRLLGSAGLRPVHS